LNAIDNIYCHSIISFVVRLTI